jgi:antitoxin (DNA-binding transcriptional repressor) of toxin-antitoxin stability system
MKVANLARVKDDLSRYVDYVKRGGRVRILVRGVPAAELVPVTAAGKSDDEAELRELERRGVIRRGTGGVPPEILRPGPKLKRGSKSMADIVLDERKSGW